MRSWLSALLLVAACGTDSVQRDGDDEGSGSNEMVEVDPDVCETSYLDYDNFGAPFVINWCRGCHSSAVPAGMRQKAPADANFDNLEQVRMWGDRIALRAAGTVPNMPPAGGPSEEERLLLAEWLACGAK
jgi:uncharacterized membrane protein